MKHLKETATANSETKTTEMHFQLEESFKEIHQTEVWKNLLPVFLDLTRPLFNSDPQHINQYYILLYELEENQHKEDPDEMAFCLKHHMENAAVAKLLWSAEPPPVRYIL